LKKIIVKNGTKLDGTTTGSMKKVVQVLLDNEPGLTVKIMRKLTGLPRRTLYNALKRLREENFVVHIRPVWKLCQNKATSDKLAQLLVGGKCQLHDLSFVVRLGGVPSWWGGRENKILKFKDFGSRPVVFGRNRYVQLVRDSFVIHVFGNSLVFFAQKKYFGEDSYECFLGGVKDFLGLLGFVEERFGFRFFVDGVPQATVRTQHYVNLGDVVAKMCERSGERFRVFVDGELRLLVDFSKPYGVEAVHKDFSPEDMSVYARHVKDFIVNDPPLASEFQEQLRQINEVILRQARLQGEYAENIKAHVDAIREMAQTQRELRVEIGKLRKLRGGRG